jgi:hypothetical protein
LTSSATVTYLTLIGKPGSAPIAEGTSVESEGQRFVVDHVVSLANGSWQANAVPARIWRRFDRPE